MVQLQLRQIRVLPGHRVLLENMSWTDFEAILDEFGEHRGTQIAYSKGMLEIIAPLPEHETAKVFIKRGQSEVMSSVRQAFRQWVREWLTR